MSGTEAVDHRPFTPKRSDRSEQRAGTRHPPGGSCRQPTGTQHQLANNRCQRGSG